MIDFLNGALPTRRIASFGSMTTHDHRSDSSSAPSSPHHAIQTYYITCKYCGETYSRHCVDCHEVPSMQICSACALTGVGQCLIEKKDSVNKERRHSSFHRHPQQRPRRATTVVPTPPPSSQHSTPFSSWSSRTSSSSSSHSSFSSTSSSFRFGNSQSSSFEAGESGSGHGDYKAHSAGKRHHKRLGHSWSGRAGSYFPSPNERTSTSLRIRVSSTSTSTVEEDELCEGRQVPHQHALHPSPQAKSALW